MKTWIFFLLFPICIFSASGYFEPWGEDSDLTKIKTAKEPLKPTSIFTKVADKIIVFHQEVISPVDGPRSHFRPTSSRYMQLAMQRYGFFQGFIMGCDRLLRENADPWVYRTVEIDGKLYKYDPPKLSKKEK